MKKNFKFLLTKTGISMAAAALAIPALIFADSFSEPQTTFYGQVVLKNSQPPHQLHEGELSWTIKDANGEELVLNTELFRFNNGVYSYRLDVPHQAVGLDLSEDGSFPSLPLASVNQLYAHFDISLDGVAAVPIGPAGTTFEVSQGLRTSAYRLDLAVDLASVDTDGDGLADWWEDRFGLDKQDGSDATLDGDGDGISNLDEAKLGLDPTVNNTYPQIATGYLLAYADGDTAFVLNALDADSSPSQLTYEVTSVPSSGTLFFRNQDENPAAPDAVMNVGDTFTQEDANNGRILFVYDDESLDPLSLGLILSDEDPDHPSAALDLPVYVYRPGETLITAASGAGLTDLAGGETVVDSTFEADEQRLRNYLLSAVGGYIIRDGSASYHDLSIGTPSSAETQATYADHYVPAYGEDHSHVLLGGIGDDKISGGAKPDVLIGGAGNNELTGNEGADWFVFLNPEEGEDVITDFSKADFDVIDLSRLVVGDSEYISDFLLLEYGETGPAVLKVDANGDGSGYTNLAITINGLSQEEAVLSELFDEGRIVVAGRKARPVVTVAALQSAASENGPTPATFVFTRSGSIAEAVTVDLSVGGSAVNGVDYSAIANSLIFPANVRQLTLDIQPFADSLTEVPETVEIVVVPGSGYNVGIIDRAAINIEDLKVMLEVEALEKLAVKDTLSPGAFLITRSAVLDRSVLVRFALGGSAQKNVDYQGFTSYVNLAPNQTTAILEVLPLADGELDGGYEDVTLTLTPDVSYFVGPDSAAQVILVNSENSLGAWRAKEFPSFEGTQDDFASADSTDSGLANLLVYAFGMDPSKPDAQMMPKFHIVDGHLAVDFNRRDGASDVEYRVNFTTNMLEWPEGQVEDVTETLTPGEDVNTRFRTKQPVDSATWQIITLEVFQKP